MDRGIAIAGTASGLVLVAFAASASELVPAVFGEQWRAAGTIFPFICAALLVAGPLSVVAVGFLYAGNEPSVVVKVTIVHTIVVFAVALPLLPTVGPEAIGMGSLSGAIVDAAIMATAIARRSAARPLRAHLPTLVIAAPAALIGMAVTAGAGTGLVAAIAGGLAAACVYLLTMTLVRRAVLVDTARMIIQAVVAASRENGRRSRQRPRLESLFELPRDARPREHPGCTLAARRAELRAPLRVAEQLSERVGERPGVVPLHEQAGLAVHDAFHRAAGASRHHGTPAAIASIGGIGMPRIATGTRTHPRPRSSRGALVMHSAGPDAVRSASSGDMRSRSCSR